MRFLTRLLAWLAAIGLAAVVTLGILIQLDRRPLVAHDIRITDREHAWVRDWLSQLKPQDKRPGDILTLALSERELNLIANDLLDRFGQGRAAIQLEKGRAKVAASLGVPWDPAGTFVNLELDLVAGERLPRVESAYLAGLPIPASLVQGMADRTLAAVDRTRLIRALDIQRERVRVTYEWEPNLLDRIGSGLISDDELPRVLRYQDRLAEAVRAVSPDRPLTLSELLALLMSQAASEPDSTDPIAANRAVIMLLAAYVNGQTIADPNAPHISKLPVHTVLLRGRQDLGQHFMASAAMVVQGGNTLSNLIGWYKEMSDSDGGSGFSFADMAANRSGIRFAELATRDRDSARQLQRIASRGLIDDDFMPRIDGLPEGMTKRDFEVSFGGQQDPAYQGMIARIDRQIEERRLYRAPPG